MSENRVPLLRDRTAAEPADASRIRPDIVVRPAHLVDVKAPARS